MRYRGSAEEDLQRCAPFIGWPQPMHDGNAPGSHHRKRSQRACETKEEEKEETAKIEEHGNGRRAFPDGELFVCGHGACHMRGIEVCDHRKNHRHSVLVHRREHHKLMEGECNQKQQGKPCLTLLETCD